MPIIVVCNVFQERLAFDGKCLLSSFVMCFKRVGHFTGMPLIVVSHCLKSLWHFTAYALDSRV